VGGGADAAPAQPLVEPDRRDHAVDRVHLDHGGAGTRNAAGSADPDGGPGSGGTVAHQVSTIMV